MTRFSNQTLLITGGTSGIGLAGARRVVAEGGRVIVTGTDPGRLAMTAQALAAPQQVLDNDAGDPAATTALRAAAEQAGGLHGLWLNAGYADLNTVEGVSAGDFDRMMAVNVRGPMLQLAALASTLQDEASVLITSSTATYEGAAATSLYAATKGALVAMARSWASALAPRGIRVNVLVPGPIESRLRDFLPEADRRSFETAVLAQVPLGRVGTADEAAAVALFLLSKDASYVTGSQYAVDGGMTMR